MKSIETSGKTVEEAVQMGLRELKLDSSDVTIDVLDVGSPGLFGMFGRLAKVRLTVKEDDDGLNFAMPVMSLNEQPQKEAAKAEKKRAPKAEKRPEPKPEKAAEPKVEVPAEPIEKKRPEPKRERRERQRREPEELILAPREDLPARPIEELSEVERLAYDFLADLTRLMGVNVEIRVQMGEGRMQAQMIGDTLGILIGRRGETLDSLQYLTSLIVNKGRDEYIRVSLDTEHYRARREEALYKLAARMASRVKRTRSRVVLEPMNPYERRVLHAALQDDPQVTTHSEGEDPYRRVVITMK